MVFDYYHRLSAGRQSIYRQSDEITRLQLPNPAKLQSAIAALDSALHSENCSDVEKLCQQISNEIVSQIKVPEIRVQVLTVRPSDDTGELHGLYLPEEDGEPAWIKLWMRTAKHKRVVAFRSFLRTLLHEICHHLDYELFHFPETFHTEGFYDRESSLFRQLIPGESSPKKRRVSAEKRLLR